MTQKLPEKVLNFIDKYFNLHIKGHIIICPYFINRNRFLRSPVYAGKGTPEEIEKTTNALIKYKNPSKEQILYEMHQKGIGIDCSGLVYQIYEFWLSILFNKSLSEFLPNVPVYNLRKYMSRKLKPQNSVGANELTSEPFAKKINLQEVKAGDMIRTRGGKHVLLITEVKKKYDKVEQLKFVHSSSQYKRDGVRYGQIYLNEIQDINFAHWNDDDVAEPVNWAYKGYKDSINNNGIFRPNIPIFKE